jgi:hypothetical protein
MNAARLADVIRELIESYKDCGADALGEPELDGANVGTFVDAGVLTADAGLVVTLHDGSKFQVTVVQSKGAL